uniref:Dihydroorotate oxidase B, electron transfer subunit n=1 Tax=Candidatus Kentrum eta TaxID=2126337 RepID=A0A450UQ70_9GAMM|nr:MAG: dihydroorotate oxidase B, electron transfer subunit [Candidatus Kentron sp. H]VFJ95171.1 MAG: dihydroorotate oxidase B, electron transfer subunit [Candidatus Kentron sp. H]VFK01739.1 MAG: dihydroorotate oxidase B, electron transfer subunit [Candidatus Kentron sp. H]
MHRATLFVEQAEILSRESFQGDRIILRIAAPRIAAAALPGTFLHVRCDPERPMRRPISLMAAEPASGRLTILFKVVGKGTERLAARAVGDVLDIIGPIGTGFRPLEDRPRALLVGGGLGIPPMVFLAGWLAQGGQTSKRAGEGGGGASPAQPAAYRPLLLMGSEIPFPFHPCPSRLPVPAPDGVTAAMPLMEALGIPSRLASRRGYPGSFNGWVTALARTWLMAQPPGAYRDIALYACGPEPMLRATAHLAREYDLPCQVCLEEFMACGVGACAGCAVPVTTPAGVAMKRVCVDGPVFDAGEVFG